MKGALVTTDRLLTGSRLALRPPITNPWISFRSFRWPTIREILPISPRLSSAPRDQFRPHEQLTLRGVGCRTADTGLSVTLSASLSLAVSPVRGFSHLQRYLGPLNFGIAGAYVLDEGGGLFRW